MIATVTLNPTLDKTVTVDGLVLDEANRWTSFRRDPGGKAELHQHQAAAIAENTALRAIWRRHCWLLCCMCNLFHLKSSVVVLHAV